MSASLRAIRCASVKFNHAAKKSINCADRLQCFSTAPAKVQPSSVVPDSITRVGAATAFPNEYPGQVYAFNWCLNGDGVTPLKKSAWRITKPLDLKVAGLGVPKTRPLKVQAAAASKMPEAGSEKLTFEQFDGVSQRTRDLLSLADSIYCPEGHIPGTRSAARVITNSKSIAPDVAAYLERAPRLEPPISLPITAYLFEGATTDGAFAGYAIEEIEVPIESNSAKDEMLWSESYAEDEDPPTKPKSVAAIVVVAEKLDIKTVVAGLEASQKALVADELKRSQEQQQQKEE